MKKLLILVASLTTHALSLSQATDAPNPLVIAHRGSSAQAPENTLPAFQLAWKQGADGIEADFQLTKDGHIDPLLRELASSGLTHDQVVVICFDSAVLKSLKERDPKWQSAWLCSFEKRANGTPRIASARVIKTLREIKALALMSGGGEVNKDLLDTIRAAGIEHYVWTINNPKLAPTYRAQGVDAIITDLPAEMRAALLEPAGQD
jgi:glycerophosphoryl diester phosphodiesterase